MWNRLIEMGAAGEQILAAWIAKEELRALLTLARTHPSRHRISQHLWAFYQWCADTDITELHRLARTIQTWWPQIEAFIHTGVTNTASEGINRLIKLEARNAFGFRNPVNQRLRSRCASIRAARRRAKPGQLRRPPNVRTDMKAGLLLAVSSPITAVWTTPVILEAVGSGKDLRYGSDEEVSA